GGAQHATGREHRDSARGRGGMRATDPPARPAPAGGAGSGGGARPPPGGSAAVRGGGPLPCSGGRGAVAAQGGGHSARGARRARVSERADPSAGVLRGGGAGAAAPASERGGVIGDGITANC